MQKSLPLAFVQHEYEKVQYRKCYVCFNYRFHKMYLQITNVALVCSHKLLVSGPGCCTLSLEERSVYLIYGVIYRACKVIASWLLPQMFLFLGQEKMSLQMCCLSSLAGKVPLLAFLWLLSRVFGYVWSFVQYR